MADYNLSGLTTRTFEKLVQALAVKYLGPAVTVFGDGPDGGREATFDGRSQDTRVDWNGYVVIQAKFRQRTEGEGGQEWALAELKKELDSYKKNAQRRRPKYYIFATNVVFTPAQTAGGKDRARKLFDAYSSGLGMEDLWVWDYDQLGSFLDGAEDIRRAYAAFITSGDVLAAVLDALDVTPDFKLVITNYISKELLAAQFAKLEEAGYAGEDRILLSRVFVDLPVSDHPQLEPPRDEQTHSVFAKTVVALAGERLDPESAARSREAKGADAGKVLGRIMLVGGPGQGKSTIGQFVCQLFRAALLKTVPSWSLPDDVGKVLRALDVACVKEGLPLPTARRFPVQIVLGEFAAAISRRNAAIKDGRESQPLTLLQFLADKVAFRTGMTISAAAFRRWLAVYPWLLILDGLDEVPSSSNRDDVLNCIDDFWVDANQQNADLLVVATTRPQGYGAEFAAMSFQHLWLLPLSPSRALGYGARLLEARYGDDTDRRSKVLGRLAEATQVDATARLMRSPLQVTIMSTLLDQIGRAPQDRWRLFHEYYQTIYRREMERDTPTAPLLSQFRSDIDTLHYTIAWELQIESERSGGTDARLPVDRFRDILRSKILEKGFEPSDFAALESQLVEAVENRLVFLVSPQAGVVGFEIRSLQEFMAAQYLMTGRTLDVQARLRAIAPASSWRNVFLFAAGRCFSVDEHLRDTVHTICVDLNHDLGGRVGAAIKAGSRLAQELLEDGLADRQPKYARLLATCALELLDTPPTFEQSQLSAIWSLRLEELFRGALVTRLAADPLHRGAWVFLIASLDRSVEWLDRLAEEHRPRLANEVNSLLELANYGRVPAWLVELFVQHVSSAGPLDEFVYPLLQRAWEAVDTPTWLKELLGLVFFFQDEPPGVRIYSGTADVMDAYLPSIAGAQGDPRWNACLSAPDNVAWRWLGCAAQFIASPSKEALRAFCEAYAESTQQQVQVWIPRMMPWPLLAMVQSIDRGTAIPVLDLLERDVLGGPEDWIRAEERWLSDGVHLDELAERSAALPFDPLSRNGIPFIDAIGHGGTSAFRLLIAALRNAHDPISRGYLAKGSLDSIERSPEDVFHCNVDDIDAVISALPEDAGVDVSFVNRIAVSDSEMDRLIEVLDRLGRVDALWAGIQSKRLDDILVDALRRGVTTVGITRLIALLASGRHYRGAHGSLRAAVEVSRLGLMMQRETPIERQSYVVIKCASDIATEEYAQLAEDVIAMEASLQGQTMQMCVRATIANDTTTHGIEMFYLHVWERARDSKVIGHAATALSEIFRRRRADVSSVITS